MSYESTVLARSPSLYVPFTETSGTSFADLTGNGHDGALISHVTPGGDDGPILGQKAAVCEIVGTSYGQWAEVDFGSPASLPTGANFTYEMWLRFPANAAFGNPRMLFRLRGLFGGFFVWRIYQGVDDATMFVDLLNDPAGHDAGSNVAVRAVNCWHHYVGTLAGETWSVYIDGVSQFTDTSASWASTFTPDTCLVYNTDEDTLLPFSLNHLAVYPVALTADEVAANYAAATPRQDGDCFPAWVRLGHSSGQGYWQSRGDVTEEWAGGARRLLLPLPELTATPTTLMGQDPATNLPAYCPAPMPSTTTVILGGGGSRPAPPTTCVQMRCGVSFACANHLDSLYEQWSDWLDPLVAGVTDFALLALVIDPFFDALIGAMDLASDIAIAKGMQIILKTGVGAITGNLFDQLNPDEVIDLQKPLFCQLACAGDVVRIAAHDITVWHDAVASETGLPGLSRDLLTLLLQFTPLANWQASANEAGASTACDTWTCP